MGPTGPPRPFRHPLNGKPEQDLLDRIDLEQRRTDLTAAFADLPITPRVIERSLEVQRALAATSQHRGVSLPDLIIAACAEVHDAAVVHYDADYDRIAAITGQPVEWVVPSGSIKQTAAEAPDEPS